jgi:hypothetical protein
LQKWERQIRERANARTARLFKERLERRASTHHAKVDNCGMIVPLNPHTVALLLRPPELDYSLIGALAIFLGLLKNIHTLLTQVLNLD